MNEKFDPANVPIPVTLNFQQVNLLLEGLGKLPFERVEALYLGLRQVALQTLQQAESAHNNPPVEGTEVEEVKQ
jgi:hypothetical protein